MSKPDYQLRSRMQINWPLIILLLPGLLSALALGAGRYGLEARNRSVELSLDYAEIQSLSVATGTSIPIILERFKESGVTAVAINEDLLGDLVATGQAAYTWRSSEVGPLTLVRIGDNHLAARVLRALSVRLTPGMVSPDLEKAGHGEPPNAFVVRAAPLTLNTIGLGLPPDAVRLVKRAGLDVVARLQNHPALTRQAVLAAVSDLRHDGVTRLICSGDEVLGFRGLVPYAAESIKSAGLIYGSIEFAKQKGDVRMSKELDSELIRVHSIPYAEMAGMSPSTAVERFTRAIKERNIRLCYVRLLETSGEDPVESNLDFVSAIREDTETAGYSVGVARPFHVMTRSPLLLALMALSVAAGVVLLLGALVSLSFAWRYGLLLLVTGAAGVIALALSGEIGRQLLALAAALTFSALGVTALVGPYLNRQGGDSPLRTGIRAAVLFGGVSALTLCGALLVVGFLADRSYMVKVNQFIGIKAAHLLPMLFVLFMMAAGLPIRGKPFHQVVEDARESIRSVVGHPLFVWHALAVVVALGIIGLALMRTGNDPGVGVSGVELKLRAILDRLLAVRPRTKEFLIGHPALILGIAFLLARKRSWGLPLVALGVLGQVSLLNTFCHIHTPLQVSILRAANGLVLGLALGLAAWLALRRLVRPDAGRPGKM